MNNRSGKITMIFAKISRLLVALYLIIPSVKLQFAIPMPMPAMPVPMPMPAMPMIQVPFMRPNPTAIMIAEITFKKLNLNVDSSSDIKEKEREETREKEKKEKEDKERKEKEEREIMEREGPKIELQMSPVLMLMQPSMMAMPSMQAFAMPPPILPMLPMPMPVMPPIRIIRPNDRPNKLDGFTQLTPGGDDNNYDEKYHGHQTHQSNPDSRRRYRKSNCNSGCKHSDQN